jgi:hypothetical protein
MTGLADEIEVSPAAARLYTRAVEIEGEAADLSAEYAHIRDELSRLLGLDSQDLHPLDDCALDPARLDPTWTDDDPRYQAWLQVSLLRMRLGEAMIECIFGPGVLRGSVGAGACGPAGLREIPGLAGA